MNLLKHKLVRYLISGGTAAAVDLLFLYLFTSIWHIWYLFSAIWAFLIAFIVSFLLQKFWTFADHSVDRWHRQMAAYFIVTSTNLGLNTLLMYLLVDFVHWPYLIAQIAAGALVAVESFFVYRKFIFASASL